MRLYDLFIYVEAKDRLSHLNLNAEAAFPFPHEMVRTMGNGAIVTEDRPPKVKYVDVSLPN